MSEKKTYTEMADESIARAMDFLEAGDEMTADELDQLLADEEAAQSAADLLDCRRAMLAADPSVLPDVEQEWKRFNFERGNHKAQHPRFKIQPLWLLAAAAVLLLFVFVWNKREAPKEQPLAEGMVLKAAPESTDIIMETDDGKEYTLDGHTDKHVLATLGATIEADSSMMLSTQTTGDTRYLTLTIPRGKTYKLTLSDGTQVYLNTDCQLSYPTRFTGKERIVKLEGEAYFKVKPDAQHPFVVQTEHVTTRVLGTEFNIRAYASEAPQVTLISGSVELVAANRLVLKPGEQAQLDVQSSTFNVEHVDIDSYYYWNEGYFYFDNEPLVNVMQAIGRWYNVNVVFNNKEAMNYMMHFLCERSEGLEQAVRLLNSLQKAQVSIDGNTIYID